MTENQQILYDYAVDFVLPTLRPGGIWVAPDPAPLTAEEIVETFKRILDHSAYEGHTLVTDSEDGIRVAIRDGKIEKEDRNA